MSYIPRIVDQELRETLQASGAVLIEGPKWCGKTTTAQTFAKSSLMLDDPQFNFASKRLAQTDPSGALIGDNPRLIDEWQEVPKIWDAVRFSCDQRPGKGLYILTGSATPNDANAPAHSGTGRITRLYMSTMTIEEMGLSTNQVSISGLFQGKTYTTPTRNHFDLENIAELVVRGGWPDSIGLPAKTASRMANSYIESVCSSDISRIDGVRRDPEKVLALVQSLARNESTLASLSSIISDLGTDISRPTITTYLSILDRLHFIDDIPAWNPALRSPVPLRQTKKHHLADPSLAAAAIGASVDTLITDTKTLGLLFESLVLHDLKVYAQAIDARVYHYHDVSDLEVDSIVQKRDGRWIALEIKLSSEGIEKGCKNLCKLEKRMIESGNRKPEMKAIIVGFGETARVTDDVQIVPVETLGL